MFNIDNIETAFVVYVDAFNDDTNGINNLRKLYNLSAGFYNPVIVKDMQSNFAFALQRSVSGDDDYDGTEIDIIDMPSNKIVFTIRTDMTDNEQIEKLDYEILTRYLHYNG